MLPVGRAVHGLAQDLVRQAGTDVEICAVLGSICTHVHMHDTIYVCMCICGLQSICIHVYVICI